MNKSEMFEILRSCPIVAILRGVTPEEVIEVCQALLDNGVKFAEITMNSPRAAESIKLAAEYFADTELNIGAGTVLTPEHVEQIAAAGGTYIISPNCNPVVIKKTKELGLLSCPGIFTPSEAFTALEAGADLLKLFPAGRMVPGYINDLKAVVPAEFMATGAVNAENMHEYLKHSIGVGIGSALYKAGDNAETIAQKAKCFKF